MSTLNTSNITVPSVATMVQHLVDSDPHPQYLLGSNLLSAVSANIHLGDLADVNLGASIPENSLIVYNAGTWSAVTASTLLESTIIPYATVINAGIVRLTASAGINDVTDSSSVITPATLAAWGSGKGFISSGNFAATLSATFSSWRVAKVEVPLELEQLYNVHLTSGASVGQYLTVESYDEVTSRPVWTNKTLVTPKAKSDEFGIVRIATGNEIISGPTQTYDQMEISGHAVPSVASLKSITGDMFISRVSAGGTSTVYSSIYGHTSSQGTTPKNISTVVNTNGVIVDHIVAGGDVIVKAGHVVNMAISGILDSAVWSAGNVYVTDTGSIYDTKLDREGILTVGGNASTNLVAEAHEVNVLGGSYDSTTFLYTNFHNSMTVGANGYVNHVIIGSNYNSTVLSLLIASNTSEMYQGVVNVNSKGVVEHCIVNGRGTLNVNLSGKVYHATLRGKDAIATVSSAGYIENCVVYSGGSVVVMPGGEINGLTVYESASITVSSGGSIYGFVKYAGCTINSAAGAYIQKVAFIQSDVQVYSSGATDFNISSSVATGPVVVFSANAHPTGLRKAVTSLDGTTTHTFYPMAAQTRKPHEADLEFNDYTMNISGLSLWSDISTSNSLIKWFITF